MGVKDWQVGVAFLIIIGASALMSSEDLQGILTIILICALALIVLWAFDHDGS